MAIRKPSWLRSWLNKLNWDIFSWKVYVGDAIEDGIDWAIDWINWGIGQAVIAYGKALEAWDKAVEIGKELGKTINREIDKVLARIATWWGDLDNWWSAKREWVKDRIAQARDTLEDRIDDVRGQLSSLLVAWDNFWENTWPQLLKDFGALGVKVGNFFTLTLPTLASKLDVGKAFDDFRLEWKDFFNFWGSLGREVMEFFTDPLQWVYDKLDEWFERFW